MSGTLKLAKKLAKTLKGGEVIELVGDIGAGKTTFTKELAKRLGVEEEVVSPTFTISRRYSARDGLSLHHYDFYRLDDPGIMQNEILESVAENKVITIIEWAGVVSGVLPAKRITVKILSTGESSRTFEISGTEDFQKQEPQR